MMLMPLTAKKMGVKNVFAPDENIMGGARYLAYMRERIPARIRDPDRTWLAMAAYNIGIGHLEDARIITQMRKKNPDRWSEVRVNLPRLQEQRWYSRVKHGYARGEETAQFVERVSQFSSLLEVAIPDHDHRRRRPATALEMGRASRRSCARATGSPSSSRCRCPPISAESAA